ncbi:MAG: hypothetical protein K2W82_16095 [Candidatus Obscuribacterales bacterium]|nr:hypothetical protein [Candidatus Obscuribacterales bacterium]
MDKTIYIYSGSIRASGLGAAAAANGRIQNGLISLGMVLNSCHTKSNGFLSCSKTISYRVEGTEEQYRSFEACL